MDDIIECFYTNDINQAFISRFQLSKNDKVHTTSAFVRFYCDAFCDGFFEKHRKF